MTRYVTHTGIDSRRAPSQDTGKRAANR